MYIVQHFSSNVTVISLRMWRLSLYKCTRVHHLYDAALLIDNDRALVQLPLIAPCSSQVPFNRPVWLGGHCKRRLFGASYNRLQYAQMVGCFSAHFIFNKSCVHIWCRISSSFFGSDICQLRWFYYYFDILICRADQHIHHLVPSDPTWHLGSGGTSPDRSVVPLLCALVFIVCQSLAVCMNCISKTNCSSYFFCISYTFYMVLHVVILILVYQAFFTSPSFSSICAYILYKNKMQIKIQWKLIENQIFSWYSSA